MMCLGWDWDENVGETLEQSSWEALPSLFPVLSVFLKPTPAWLCPCHVTKSTFVRATNAPPVAESVTRPHHTRSLNT